MMAAPAIGNLGWLAASAPEYGRYRRDATRVERVQRARLATYLERNAVTAFGRAHGFARISCWEDYAERVPAQSYDDVAPYIERIARGEEHVLTADPVRLFEPSSGSSGPAKWIPYTHTMQQEIRRAVAVWATALFRSHPGLLLGPAYWSLTPQLAAPAGNSRIPVGFDEDSAYLGGLAQRLVRSALVTHPALRRMRDIDQFLDATLLLLLQHRDLRLISVWHPSFLTLLVQRLRGNWAALAVRVGTGLTGGQHGIDIGGDPVRARELERIGGPDPQRIWPHLGVISCWADAHAEAYVPRVGELFPGVCIQAKGLVATEAFVTVPLGDQRPLAIRSHVFEFIDENGHSHPPWLLTVGQRYEVLVTTGGGLYRYRLGDRVEVDGFFRGIPSLRFLGKEDQVSDYFGEKLTEPFVTSVLERVLADTGAPPPEFSLLAMDERTTPPAYTLYVESAGDSAAATAAALERALRKNPHYDYCRRIGQLGAATVTRVGPGAYDRYAMRLTATGMRLGDIKPVSLSPLSDWQNWLLESGRL